MTLDAQPAKPPRSRAAEIDKTPCPFCESKRSTVVDTWDGVKRRRECADCGRRYTTREVVSDAA